MIHLIIGHLRKHDSAHALLLFAAIAVMLSVWLIFSSALNEPSPQERQASNAEHVVAIQEATKAPILAQTPLTKDIPVDYTIPTTADDLAPVVTRVATSQPIVFLTIDDGAYKDPTVVATLAKYHVKASLFLAKLFTASNPTFFSQITAQGSYIEDHTLSHDLKMAKNMNYGQQKAEICGMADYELQTYGRRPIFYRPPGGAYSDVMRRAAHDCGMTAVVTWMVTINNGSLQYQVGSKLRPGDIVLMHFRPTFVKDIEAFIAAAKDSGLHMALLEDANGL